jgi:antitoxin (DNA-binding transcriptional repressor) of toxin-antitoxin stability system
MKTVSDSTLKAKITEVFREIEATGEAVQVTHDGEAVLKIISYHRDSGGTEARNGEHGAPS